MSKLWWNPRVYQDKAVDFALGGWCRGLFLDMGLGKTASMLEVICILLTQKSKQLKIKKTIVIAPSLVAQTTWGNEINKWTNFNHLKYKSLVSSKKPEREKWVREDADIYGLNPESLVWFLDLPDEILDQFDCIIIDESSKFKNPSAKRFLKLQKNLHRFKSRYILTGTPIPNGMEDLWAQVFILDQGERLGKNITRFRQTYFHQNRFATHTEYVLRDGAEAEILDKIKDICLTMSAEDYLDLPDMIYNEVLVDLPKEHMRTYKELERDYYTYMSDNDFTAANAAVAAGKCRQLASGGLYENNDEFVHDYDRKVWHNIHDVKTNKALEMVESLEGSPVMIMYEFKHDLDRLQKAFPKAQVFGSGMKTLDATQIVKDWNKGRIPTLLCQPASMGHGLNMQDSGSNVIWYTIPWNLETFQQANKRLHRPGQTKPVYIHLIAANKTIDIDVLDLIGLKASKQSSFLEKLHNFQEKQ